jgi:hypothetical protein
MPEGCQLCRDGSQAATLAHLWRSTREPAGLDQGSLRNRLAAPRSGQRWLAWLRAHVSAWQLGPPFQTEPRQGSAAPGTARLEEAVAAIVPSWRERTRARVPLDWAMTQNNLGAALGTLGERKSGTARLEAAVVAYRLALEERTLDRVPLDWAMTQMNLGNALRTLGQPSRLAASICCAAAFPRPTTGCSSKSTN